MSMPENQISSIEHEVAVLDWNVLSTSQPLEIARHLKQISTDYPALDVICLQEVPLAGEDELPTELALWLEGVGHSGCVIPEHKLHGFVQPPYSAYCAHLNSTPHPGAANSVVRLSDGGALIDRLIGERKTLVLMTELKLPQWPEPLRVANVHLPWLSFCSAARRNEIIEQLMLLAEQMEESFVMVGDFNAIPESKTVKTLQERLTMLNGRSPTWRMLGATAAIDYAFVSQDLKGRTIYLPYGPSDHKPLLFYIGKR